MLYSVRDFFTEVDKTGGNTAFFSCGGSGESGLSGGKNIYTLFSKRLPVYPLFFSTI